MTTDGATAHFEPQPACAAEARRFVASHLHDWDLGRFDYDATLCATELATNAILHCRGPFTVSVRPLDAGARIDVQDDRPDLLPVVLPSGLDPLASGTTGRGLTLVAAMSNRWGYFTTDLAKTVWTELSDDRGQGVREPLIELAARPRGETGRQVRLVDLPVGAAVASGVQIDDLVREVQLHPGRLSPAERTRFYRLLERCAAPRLIGRQEAFRAAAGGLDRYTLELTVSADELAALSELVAFLNRLAEGSDLRAGRVAPEVETMRAWLRGEVVAQFAGRAPSVFPHAALDEYRR